jgi:hypothetical protein
MTWRVKKLGCQSSQKRGRGRRSKPLIRQDTERYRSITEFYTQFAIPWELSSMQMHIHSMHDAMISLRRSFIRSIPNASCRGYSIAPLRHSSSSWCQPDQSILGNTAHSTYPVPPLTVGNFPLIIPLRQWPFGKCPSFTTCSLSSSM